MGCGRQTSSGFRTTNNVLLSPESGWEQGEILLIFSSFSSEWLLPPLLQGSQAGGQLAFLAPGNTNGSAMESPQSAHGPQQGNKTLSKSETKCRPFHSGRGRPGEGAGRPLAPSLPRRRPGPQPKDGRRRREPETYSDASLPALRWHHGRKACQVSKLEHPRIPSCDAAWVKRHQADAQEGQKVVPHTKTVDLCSIPYHKIPKTCSI